MSEANVKPLDDDDDGISPRRRIAELVFVGVVTVAWALLLRRFQEGNIYEVMGPLAVVLVAVTAARRPARAAQLLRPTVKLIALGLGVGLVMTLLVYPVFAVAVDVMPGLRPKVAELYAGAEQSRTWLDALWLLAIVVAEEVLWRGTWIRVLKRHVTAPLAIGALSLALYAGAQLGSGSWIVGLLAVACGTVWTAQRMLTESLVPPLLSHSIFTFVVLFLKPVVS